MKSVVKLELPASYFLSEAVADGARVSGEEASSLGGRVLRGKLATPFPLDDRRG